jgi:hypothetical protein
MKRLPYLALLLVVGFAGAVRVVRLHTTPPGLFFDEAANLFDIAGILQGNHPLYFPANNGREPFFFYWASLFALRWGVTPYALRLAAAVLGTLTVPATFFCARELYLAAGQSRRWATWAAVAAALVLAVTYPHLHYSRFGLRTISLPFFLALGFGFLFRGLRRSSWVALVIAGFFGGMTTYTYISARLAPALLAVPPLVEIRGRRFRPVLGRCLVVFVVWVAVSAPLGMYALRHPADVFQHTDDVSILNPVNNHGDPVGAVLRGAVLTFGAVDFVGSQAGDQNLPGRPIFDPILSLFLGVGLVFIGSRIRRWPVVDPKAPLAATVPLFLLAWLVDQSLPSIFAVSPPGYVRLSGIYPPLAILAGAGVAAAFAWLRQREHSGVLAGAFVGVGLAVSAGWTIRDYFFLWGPSPVAYTWMMGHKVDSANYLNQLASSDRVFLAPLYAQDNTIRFLTRDHPPGSFDLGLGLVIPTDRSRAVAYVFPADDSAEASQVAGELPSRPTVSTIADPTGRFPLLLQLSLAPELLPTQPSPPLATFEGGIDLVGVQIRPDGVAPGQTAEISLEWLARQRQPDNYTVFVHIVDGKGTAIGQVDGQPTAGSYPTTSWLPGDLIWDRHRLTIPPGAAPGNYRVVVGLYRLATLKRLVANTPQGRADSDEVSAGTLAIKSP